MGENILFIPPIPQYGVIIEDPRQAGRSIFEPAYRCAADNVMKIIRSSRLYDQQKGQKIQNAAREEFLNTIVAFTGARGSGKSSAMLSFAKMLKESTLDFWKTEDKVRKTDYAIIRDSSFWVMSALDSTKMGKGEQLLASVAARMFKEYQKHLNEGKIPHTVTVEQKREFLTQIQKVTRESIMDGRDKKEEDESILLQNTVEQIDARSNVEKLVEIFLKMMFGKSEDAYLVITIDDLDMNLSDSYGIVDDIRKHLTIPHVIVLTSICIDQFRELAGIHYGKLFHEKCERCSAGDVMAQKYVEKMFPVSRQVEMPKYSLEQQQRTLIGNLIGEKTEKDPKEPTKRTEIGLNRESELPDSFNIIDGVLHLIYRKTMLLLVPDENGRHWIVPNNLRELCNLIYFLQGMKDVAFTKEKEGDFKPCEDKDFLVSGEDRLNTMEDNLRRLMQYIVSDLLDYSTDGMSDDAVQMAKTLSKLIRELRDWPLTRMNAKIVRDILSCMTADNAYRLFFPDPLRESLLKATMRDNLTSMGDVQHVLGTISHRTNLETIKRLTEYVQMIWSIRMTIEFFCVGVRYSEDGMHGSIYETSSMYITTGFRDTVGGLMFSPDVGVQFLKYTPVIQNDHIQVDRNWLMLHAGKNGISHKFYIPLDLMTVTSDVEIPKAELKKWSNPEAMSEAISTATETVLPLYTNMVSSSKTSEQNPEAAVNKALQQAALAFVAKAAIQETAQEAMSNNTSVSSDWRTFINGPYYRKNKAPVNGSDAVLYLNYFAIFTNLLSPKTAHFGNEKNIDEQNPNMQGIYSKVSNKIEAEDSFDNRTNAYLAWVKKHVMAFPFYSMDWTNRFYAVLEQRILFAEHKISTSMASTVYELNSYIRSALLQMKEITKGYIAPTKQEPLTGNDYTSRFDSITVTTGESIGDSILISLCAIAKEYPLFDKKRPMSSFVSILNGTKAMLSPQDWDENKSVYKLVYDKLISDDPLCPIPKENQDNLREIFVFVNQYSSKHNQTFDTLKKYEQEGISACEEYIDDLINTIKKTDAYKKELQTPPSENQQP